MIFSIHSLNINFLIFQNLNFFQLKNFNQFHFLNIIIDTFNLNVHFLQIFISIIQTIYHFLIIITLFFNDFLVKYQKFIYSQIPLVLTIYYFSITPQNFALILKILVLFSVKYLLILKFLFKVINFSIQFLILKYLVLFYYLIMCLFL